MAKVKKGIVKWLLDAVNDGGRRAPGDVPVKKPPTKKSSNKTPPKNQQKPPPKNKQKPPPTSKPKVRQRNDGLWAVVGSPKKTYGSKSAATKAANKATAAAEAAKRAEEAAKLKKHLGQGLGVLTVGGLGAGIAFSGSDKKDDKNKDQGPTRKKAEASKSANKKRTAAELELIPKGARPPAAKPATKPANKKRTAAELELIPKGARPPAVKKPAPKPAPKPATQKRTAAELELIPKGATKLKPKKPAAKPAPKKLKPFEQGVRFVDTPFGKIKMDTTDEGMAMEFFDSKYGGQVKGKIKRRMGGIVKKGYGKAQRGY